MDEMFKETPVAPIAWPIAKLLDRILGVHGPNTYKKAELKSCVSAPLSTSGFNWLNCRFLQFHRTGEEPLQDEGERPYLYLNNYFDVIDRNKHFEWRSRVIV